MLLDDYKLENKNDTNLDWYNIYNDFCNDIRINSYYNSKFQAFSNSEDIVDFMLHKIILSNIDMIILSK